MTKQNETKIGIVIPIYNVALYLRECLESVLTQSYTNFEALLVNDGSTDFENLACGEFDKSALNVSITPNAPSNLHLKSKQALTQSKSLQIALEYATKDARFVVIDKINGGLSSARNAGISYFCGELGAYENSQMMINSQSKRTRERERVS